jgi:(2Fe-2S) ferredoxin
MTTNPEKPFYQSHVFVCTNERPPGNKRGCCKEKGSEELRNYMKARAKGMGLPGVRVNNAGCLDRCEFGPVMVIYPEGIWYRPTRKEDIDLILEQHLRDGLIVESLRLKNSDVATVTV